MAQHFLTGNFWVEATSKLAVGIVSVTCFYTYIDWFSLDGTAYQRTWPIVCLLPVVYWWQHKRIQIQAVAQANRLSNIIDSGDFRNQDGLMLYLRPFLSEGQLTVNTSFLEPAQHLVNFSNSDASLDTRLARILRTRYLIVKFDGVKQPTILQRVTRFIKGFGYQPIVRLADKNSWQDIVEKACHSAETILIVPPHSTESSTADEIRTVLSKGLEHKVVFLMTRASTYFQLKDQKKISGRELWSNLKSVVGENLELPPYSQGGGWVTRLNGTWTLIQHCSGVDWSRNSSIKRVLGDHQVTERAATSAKRTALRLVLFYAPIITLTAFFAILASWALIEPSQDYHPYFRFSFLALLLIQLPWYYQYCRRFFLSQVSALLLMSTTVIGLGVSLYIFFLGLELGVEKTVIELLSLDWIEVPEVGQQEYSLSYSLFTIGLLFLTTLTTVFVVALSIFASQRVPTLRGQDRI